MKERRGAKTRAARGGRRPKGRREFVGNEEHLRTLKESLRSGSPGVWNRWRAKHPRVAPDLRGVVLPGCPLRGYDLRRARLDGAQLTRADLAGVRLEGASLKGATLISADLSSARAKGVDLSGANCRSATLHQGDFRGAVCVGFETYFARADLSKADFTRAKLNGATLAQADLTRTRFDGADLSGTDLGNAVLDETSLLGANLCRSNVNGTFVRRVKTDEKTYQRELYVDVYLTWEKRSGNVAELAIVDDIRVAQFHNIVDEPGSVGKLLAATTSRVVLILGRFLPRQKRVLDRLADALRAHGKIAVVFDFPSPENREISDTVRFIAGMSEFVVVDLTKASSVPLELQATVPDLMVPVLPIIQSGHAEFAMLSDLQRRYFWVQPTLKYKDAAELVNSVEDSIIGRAKLATEVIRKRRAATARPPESVARAGRQARKRR